MEHICSFVDFSLILQVFFQTTAALFNVNLESIAYLVNFNLQLTLGLDALLQLIIQLTHLMLQLCNAFYFTLAAFGGGDAVSLTLTILLFNFDRVHVDWLC